MLCHKKCQPSILTVDICHIKQCLFVCTIHEYTHNFDVLSPSVSKWQLCIHTSLCTQVFSTHLPDHHRFLSICVSKSISLAYVYSLCIVTLRTYVVLFNYCMIDHAQGPITSPCPGIHLCMIDLIIVCCLGFLYCRKEHIPWMMGLWGWWEHE